MYELVKCLVAFASLMAVIMIVTLIKIVPSLYKQMDDAQQKAVEMIFVWI